MPRAIAIAGRVPPHQRCHGVWPTALSHHARIEGSGRLRLLFVRPRIAATSLPTPCSSALSSSSFASIDRVALPERSLDASFPPAEPLRPPGPGSLAPVECIRSGHRPRYRNPLEPGRTRHLTWPLFAFKIHYSFLTLPSEGACQQRADAISCRS